MRKGPPGIVRCRQDISCVSNHKPVVVGYKSIARSDQFCPDNLRFRKIVPIGYRVLRLEPFIRGSLSRFLLLRLSVVSPQNDRLASDANRLARLFQFCVTELGKIRLNGKVSSSTIDKRFGCIREKMTLDSREVFDVVMSGRKQRKNVEPGPVVSIALDVPAAENRSNKFVSLFAFGLGSSYAFPYRRI